MLSVQSIKPIPFSALINGALVLIVGLVSACEIYFFDYHDRFDHCSSHIFPLPIATLCVAAVLFAWAAISVLMDHSADSAQQQQQQQHQQFQQDQYQPQQQFQFATNTFDAAAVHADKQTVIVGNILVYMACALIFFPTILKAFNSVDCYGESDTWPFTALVLLVSCAASVATSLLFLIKRPTFGCFQTKQVSYLWTIYVASIPCSLLWLMVPFTNSGNTALAQQQPYVPQHNYAQQQQQPQQQFVNNNQQQQQQQQQQGYGGYQAP